MIFEEALKHIAGPQQYHIYVIYIVIYIFLKRKFTENVLQNTPIRTSEKKSGEYAPIPLNIVRSKTLSIIFIFKMTIFIFF